jgi:hypothetical protein
MVVTGSVTGLSTVWLVRTLRGNPVHRKLVDQLLAKRRAAIWREQEKQLKVDRRPCAEIKAECEKPIDLTADQLKLLSERLAQPHGEIRKKKSCSMHELISFKELQGVRLLGQWNTFVFTVDGFPGLVFKIPKAHAFAEAKEENHEQHQHSEQLRQQLAEAGWERLVVPATLPLELEIKHGNGTATVPLLVMREAPVDFKAQELVWWDEEFEESVVEQFTRAVCRYDYCDVKYANNPACKAKDGNLIFLIDIKTFSLESLPSSVGLVQMDTQPAQLGVIRSLPPRHIERVKAAARRELKSLSERLLQVIDRDTAFQQKKASLKADLPNKAEECEAEDIWSKYDQALWEKPHMEADAAAILDGLLADKREYDLWEPRALWDSDLPHTGGDRDIRLDDTLKLLEESGVVMQVYHRKGKREWDVFP